MGTNSRSMRRRGEGDTQPDSRDRFPPGSYLVDDVDNR